MDTEDMKSIVGYESVNSKFTLSFVFEVWFGVSFELAMNNSQQPSLGKN